MFPAMTDMTVRLKKRFAQIYKMVPLPTDMRAMIADIQERIALQSERLEASRVLIANYQESLERELAHIKHRSLSRTSYDTSRPLEHQAPSSAAPSRADAYTRMHNDNRQ